MKTPMQKHIDDLLKVNNILKESGETMTDVMISAFESAIDNAKHYLEEEKQVIINAWRHGELRVPEKMKHINNAHGYYNETFKND